jgi:hypothetical protein
MLGSVFSGTRRFINKLTAADRAEAREFYPELQEGEIPDGNALELQFIDEIEDKLADVSSFTEMPDPVSILPWVLESFPPLPDLPLADVLHVPIRMEDGEVLENLQAPVNPVLVCHIELHLQQLNRAGRIAFGDDNGKVTVRVGRGGPECSRPLVCTQGELLDRFLAGRCWERGLVDEDKECDDGMVAWHHDLRSLLIMLSCAHVSRQEQRWGIYRCILDHTGTHYCLPRDLSERLLAWNAKKYAQISLSNDLRVTTTDRQLAFQGSFFVVYFDPQRPQVHRSSFAVAIGDV